MAVLVSDTSVLIDLERGSLLDELFLLPYDFAVPDILYHRELVGALGEQLVAAGLQIIELAPAEVTRASAVRRERAALSVPDAFAYALAERRTWNLLSGDGHMRTLAKENGVACNGILWVLDEFHAHAVKAPIDLRASLTTIAAHPRCRLPKAEVAKCIKRMTGK